MRITKLPAISNRRCGGAWVGFGHKLMWNCPHCGEQIEDQFDSCWKCTKPTENTLPIIEADAVAAGKRVDYRMFRSALKTWDTLFTEAATFASSLAPGQLINISHSVRRSDGVVAVWFWTEEA